MALSSFSSQKKKWILFLLAQFCLRNAIAGNVKFLPGFEGPLPFDLETGYVGVDEGEEVQVFYYFVKSEWNPKEDPVILWMTGGPSCSSLTALVFEIGPITFKMVEYNGSLPTFVSNPYSWTKDYGFYVNEKGRHPLLNYIPANPKLLLSMANIIFVDLPVGTGFSYGKTARASRSNIDQFCNHGYEFMRKWLANHPDFLSNPFYVGGDSYSGISVPILTQIISNGNEAGIEKFINLKGYILGNPLTFPEQDNYQIQFAHGMGLIPDELYELLKRSCPGGEYRRGYIDPKNIQCLKYREAYDECVNDLEFAYILDPNCGYASPGPIKSFSKGRALDESVNGIYSAKQSLSAFYCRIEGYKLSFYWANDKSVQDVLHIHKGSVKKWERCNHKDLTTNIWDSRSYHANLSKKGYRSLIYSGDHDMLLTHQSTQAWIRDLNYSIVDHWRPWKVHGQISGYTRSYSNKMTYATVKGAGHTAPEYRPAECFFMLKRWIAHKPL